MLEIFEIESGDIENTSMGCAEFSTSVNFNSSTLPIDMQFNNGHKLSIIVCSLLLLISAFGNWKYLCRSTSNKVMMNFNFSKTTTC